jgi:magnesium transporter
MSTSPRSNDPADAATPQGVVNLVAYDRSGQRLPPFTLDQISDVLEQPDTFIWMGLYEPDEALLEDLQEEFGLHDLAIEDAHNAHQRPKIDVYSDSLFIVLRTAQETDGRCRFGETHVFLGPRYLVTIRHGSSLSYAAVRARVEREPKLLALGPSYCLYAVFDFIVDNFQPIVEAFEGELHALETAIFEHEFNRAMVERLYDLKRELLRLRLAIAPAEDISNQLMEAYPRLIPEEVRPYFRDVHDHVIRIKESSDTMSEMVSAAVTVNVAMVTVGQGEVVKKLAGWAALLAAPTLIASWYGMNFKHMPELSWRWSYAVVAGVTAVVCVVLYRGLKRARWL